MPAALFGGLALAGSLILRSFWQRLRQTLLAAVTQLNERSLDDSVNQAMALYPPRTLCEQLLLPLLAAVAFAAGSLVFTRAFQDGRTQARI